MFKFITRRHFLINLLAAIVLVVGLMLLFLWSLGFITHHGDFDKVPNIKGKSMTDAKKILEDKGFKVEVLDSLYIDSLKPFAVLKQSPEADALVKSHRIVYLTINRSLPPLVEVPNMVGFSFRNAEMYLKQLGLFLGDTTRKLDIAQNSVLEQIYNGQQIKGGTKIYMGSKISFVLGSGLSEEEMDVPSIMGMTFAEARQYLASKNLSLGFVDSTGIANVAGAFVWKQVPDVISKVRNPNDTTDFLTQQNRIRAGQSVDLFLRRDHVDVPAVDSSEIKKIKRPNHTTDK